MMEGRRRLIIIIGISLLFIIAMILLYLFISKRSVNEPPVVETTPTTTESNLPIDTEIRTFTEVKNTPPPPPTTTEERERLYVKQLARTFVERFETYSNQNDNRNIEDATVLATANMAGYIATKSQPQAVEYQGATTKVISMEVTSFDGSSASVKIGAQVETQTQTTNNTSYKNGRVDMVKVGGVWKVNGVFWDPS